MNKFLRKNANGSDKAYRELRSIERNGDQIRNRLDRANNSLHYIKFFTQDNNRMLSDAVSRIPDVHNIEYVIDRALDRQKRRKQEAIMGVGLGASAGAVAGALIDRRSRLRGLLVGGLLGGLATYAIGNTADYFMS